MTERAFQDAVVEMAQVFRWRSYHTFDSRRSDAGFPDLVLVRRDADGGRVIFAELKGRKTSLRSAQAAWLEALNDCEGVETYLWRDGKINMREIEAILR